MSANKPRFGNSAPPPGDFERVLAKREAMKRATVPQIKEAILDALARFGSRERFIGSFDGDESAARGVMDYGRAPIRGLPKSELCERVKLALEGDGLLLIDARYKEALDALKRNGAIVEEQATWNSEGGPHEKSGPVLMLFEDSNQNRNVTMADLIRRIEQLAENQTELIRLFDPQDPSRWATERVRLNSGRVNLAREALYSLDLTESEVSAAGIEATEFKRWLNKLRDSDIRDIDESRHAKRILADAVKRLKSAIADDDRAKGESSGTAAQAVDQPDANGYLADPADPSAYVPQAKIRADHTPTEWSLDDKGLSKIVEDFETNRVRWTRPPGRDGKPRLNRRNIHLRDWCEYARRRGAGGIRAPNDQNDPSQAEISKRALAIRHARPAGK